MPISIGGLASGIDVDSLISGLVSVSQQPLRDLDARRARAQSASQTLTAFSSKLSSLKTAASALSNLSSFATATSSDSAVTAQTSTGALPGSYSIEVTSLAARQKSRSDAVATSGTALGQAGTLSLAYGASAPVDVTIEATDTLAQIATKINASGARVAASVVADGGQYRLLVQGLDTGAANAFTMTETGTALGLGTPANTYQAATDAAFKVDGLPQTASTNSVTALTGLTLALTKTTTGPVTVTVQTDSTVMKDKLKAFVAAYNDIVNAGHAAAGFGGVRPTNPLLAGDSAIRGSLAHLRSAASTSTAGLSGRYRSLLDIGVTMGNDGTMTLNETTFAAAFASDPTALQKVLAGDGANKGAMQRIELEVDGLATAQGGLMKARLASFTSQMTRIDDSKAKIERQVSTYETQLRKQFTDMDQIVSRYRSMQNTLGGIGSGGSGR